MKGQADFLEKEMRPRLAGAKAGSEHVFFVDAAHFVYGSFLCCLWSFARLFVRAASGRQGQALQQSGALPVRARAQEPQRRRVSAALRPAQDRQPAEPSRSWSAQGPGRWRSQRALPSA